MVKLMKRNIETSNLFLDIFSTLQVEKLVHNERFFISY